MGILRLHGGGYGGWRRGLLGIGCWGWVGVTGFVFEFVYCGHLYLCFYNMRYLIDMNMADGKFIRISTSVSG